MSVSWKNMRYLRFGIYHGFDISWLVPIVQSFLTLLPGSHVIICYCNFVTRHFWHKIDKKTLKGRIILIFGYILHDFHISTEGLPNTFPQCRLHILKRLLKLSTLPVIVNSIKNRFSFIQTHKYPWLWCHKSEILFLHFQLDGHPWTIAFETLSLAKTSLKTSSRPLKRSKGKLLKNNFSLSLSGSLVSA